jgi:hypothetical protein
MLGGAPKAHEVLPEKSYFKFLVTCQASEIGSSHPQQFAATFALAVPYGEGFLPGDPGTMCKSTRFSVAPQRILPEKGAVAD